MQASQAISVAFLVLLGACAKSEMPAPNKNTNWLEACSEESDCGEALECLCGICTVRCEADDVCADYGEPLGACLDQQSAELRAQCGEAASSDSICVLPTAVQDSGALNDDCIPMGENCATVIASNQRSPSAIVVDDTRVYWLTSSSMTDDVERSLAENGTLRSDLHAGGDVITHLGGLRGPTALELDATHAYWVQKTGARTEYDAISRVSLAGGAAQYVYAAQLVANGIGALEVTDGFVYFFGYWFDRGRGEEFTSLYRAPADGSLIFDPLQAPREPERLLDGAYGAFHGLVSAASTVYWQDNDSIRSFDIVSESENAVVDPPGDTTVWTDGSGLVRHGTHLFSFWSASSGQLGVRRINLADEADVMTAQVAANSWPAGLAADDTHVYWGVGDISSVWALMRTDHRSGQTVTFARSEELGDMRIAVSDEHVFVAARGANESGEEGYVLRFPKRTASDGE